MVMLRVVTTAPTRRRRRHLAGGLLWGPSSLVWCVGVVLCVGGGVSLFLFLFFFLSLKRTEGFFLEGFFLQKKYSSVNFVSITSKNTARIKRGS